MDTYTLTADDADKVNAATGVSSDKDGNPDGPRAEEGQEYPCVELPTGTTLVFTDSDVPLRIPGDVKPAVGDDETPENV